MKKTMKQRLVEAEARAVRAEEQRDAAMKALAAIQAAVQPPNVTSQPNIIIHPPIVIRRWEYEPDTIMRPTITWGGSTGTTTGPRS